MIQCFLRKKENFSFWYFFQIDSVSTFLNLAFNTFDEEFRNHYKNSKFSTNAVACSALHWPFSATRRWWWPRNTLNKLTAYHFAVDIFSLIVLVIIQLSQTLTRRKFNTSPWKCSRWVWWVVLSARFNNEETFLLTTASMGHSQKSMQTVRFGREMVKRPRTLFFEQWKYVENRPALLVQWVGTSVKQLILHRWEIVEQFQIWSQEAYFGRTLSNADAALALLCKRSEWPT